MSDEPDDREQARAERMGRLVDDALAGEAPPALLDVEERALLETATEIHGAIHARLSTGRRRALVDAAFAEVAAPMPMPAPPVAAPARRRPGRLAWGLCVAFACAAAALVLIVRAPSRAPEAVSRSDRLVGPITADAVDDARARLDAVYADRLALHRGALLARREP